MTEMNSFVPGKSTFGTFVCSLGLNLIVGYSISTFFGFALTLVSPSSFLPFPLPWACLSSSSSRPIASSFAANIRFSILNWSKSIARTDSPVDSLSDSLAESFFAWFFWLAVCKLNNLNAASLLFTLDSNCLLNASSLGFPEIGSTSPATFALNSAVSRSRSVASCCSAVLSAWAFDKRSSNALWERRMESRNSSISRMMSLRRWSNVRLGTEGKVERADRTSGVGSGDSGGYSGCRQTCVSRS